LPPSPYPKAKQKKQPAKKMKNGINQSDPCLLMANIVINLAKIDWAKEFDNFISLLHQVTNGLLLAVRQSTIQL
jgi:hypothetical protein